MSPFTSQSESTMAANAPKALEWHQLDKRYEYLRQRTPQDLRQLMMSIHTVGLLRPISVIPALASSSKTPLWVIVDGYLRVKACQALGQDAIAVEVCSLAADDALLMHYQSNQARPWKPLEEASLLQELITHHDYSQAQCARKFGKSDTWVSHRLQLLADLPEFIIQAVYQGLISCWSAQRVLLPFARANTQHAQQLIEYLSSHPQSSRECQAFYEHYCQSSLPLRERMIKEPGLFFKTQADPSREATSRASATTSPEERWEQRSLRMIQEINALSVLLPRVFYPQQTETERRYLEQPLVQAATLMNRLQQSLRRIPYASSTDGASRSTTASSGTEPTGNQPATGDLAQ